MLTKSAEKKQTGSSSGSSLKCIFARLAGSLWLGSVGGASSVFCFTSPLPIRLASEEAYGFGSSGSSFWHATRTTRASCSVAMPVASIRPFSVTLSADLTYSIAFAYTPGEMNGWKSRRSNSSSTETVNALSDRKILKKNLTKQTCGRAWSTGERRANRSVCFSLSNLSTLFACS